MTRDEQEMALWRETYNASMLLPGDGRNAEADAAVEAFRLRYPPQSASASEIDEETCAKGWILFLALASIGLSAFFAIAFAMGWT